MIQVSVIIPTYKPGDYIWECLDSICKQTFPYSNFEVIIVLNGCCNPWHGRIEDYITKKMNGVNVHYIQTDTPGVSNARNCGLNLAQGEYITFIDDDDYVSPTYLQELFEKSSKDTVALSYTLSFIDGDNLNFKQNRMSMVFESSYKIGRQHFFKAKSFFSGPCMKLLHRDVIRNHRFDIRLRVGEDTTFMYVISDRIKYVDFTSKNAIYFRRMRPNSAITMKRSFPERIKSNSLQIVEYTKYFIKKFPNYNFLFYLTRCGGCIRGIFR